jgi:hypothetical protein
MQVRRATAHDRGELLQMALRFIAESSYRGQIIPDQAQLLGFIDVMLAQGFLLVADDGDAAVGMLAGVVMTHPISGERVATELAWWMNPERRGSRASLQLLEYFERWAYRDHQVDAVQMVAPAGSQIGDLYRRRGYAELETTFQRRRAA